MVFTSILCSPDVDKVCFVLQDFDGGIGSIFDCINYGSLLHKQFIFLYLLDLCFSQIQNHFSRSFTLFGNIMNIIHGLDK